MIANRVSRKSAEKSREFIREITSNMHRSVHKSISTSSLTPESQLKINMDVDNTGSILPSSATADVIDPHSKVDSLEAVVSDENIKDGDILVRKLDSKPNVNVIRGATNPYSRKNPKPPFDIESEYSALLGFPAALAYLDSYIRGEILNFNDLRWEIQNLTGRLDYSRDLVLRLADKRRKTFEFGKVGQQRAWHYSLSLFGKEEDILAHQEESKVNSICKKGYLSDDLKPNLLMLQEDPAAGLRAFQLTCLDNDGSSAYECVGCKREETRETNETIPMLKISSDGLLETEYQSLKHHKNCVLASIPRFLADQLDKRARRQIALDLLPPHEAWREAVLEACRISNDVDFAHPGLETVKQSFPSWENCREEYERIRTDCP